MLGDSQNSRSEIEEVLTWAWLDFKFKLVDNAFSGISIYYSHSKQVLSIPIFHFLLQKHPNRGAF